MADGDCKTHPWLAGPIRTVNAGVGSLKASAIMEVKAHQSSSFTVAETGKDNDDPTALSLVFAVDPFVKGHKSFPQEWLQEPFIPYPVICSMKRSSTQERCYAFFPTDKFPVAFLSLLNLMMCFPEGSPESIKANDQLAALEENIFSMSTCAPEPDNEEECLPFFGAWAKSHGIGYYVLVLVGPYPYSFL